MPIIIRIPQHFIGEIPPMMDICFKFSWFFIYDLAKLPKILVSRNLIWVLLWKKDMNLKGKKFSYSNKWKATYAYLDLCCKWEFHISTLTSEDVILWAPWFHGVAIKL